MVLQDALTIRGNGPAVSPPFAGRLIARVLEGPDVGASVELVDSSPGRVLIGRGPACELRIADTGASRRHAALELVDGAMRISDLGSTNGTWLDSVRVLEAFVQPGQTIGIGATKLGIFFDQPVDATPPLPERMRFGRVVGHSREMRRLYPLCERLATARLPLLIEGETGTGKELLAESIHEAGPRSHAPFVVLDCTTISPNLVESELFGHERGAFTGATEARAGRFEQANGGTLLIDEIGDLDIAMQAKLLRVLERFEVRRVGGNRPIKVDVRVLAATRRDLDQEVQAGRFRDDLYHRLAVARIELPPLRRRRGDIPLLVGAICEQLNGDAAMLTPALMAQWEQYAWPGNIRELRNAVSRRLELGDLVDWLGEPTAGPPSVRTGPADVVLSAQVGDAIDRVLAANLPIGQARKLMLDEFERRYLARLLAAHGGVVRDAAEASGIARRHFYRLLAKTRTVE